MNVRRNIGEISQLFYVVHVVNSFFIVLTCSIYILLNKIKINV